MLFSRLFPDCLNFFFVEWCYVLKIQTPWITPTPATEITKFQTSVTARGVPPLSIFVCGVQAVFMVFLLANMGILFRPPRYPSWGGWCFSSLADLAGDKYIINIKYNNLGTSQKLNKRPKTRDQNLKFLHQNLPLAREGHATSQMEGLSDKWFGDSLSPHIRPHLLHMHQQMGCWFLEMLPR